jgi:predicted MFS family arabinose efflux permease
VKYVETFIADVGHYGIMHNKEGVSEHVIKNILTRDFLLGFFAFFFSLVAYFALYPTLPIFLVKLGSNDREIGTLIGILGASSLVSRFLVGGALTRYSGKSVMMFGALLFAFTLFASIVLRPFWPFLTLRFLQGITYACISTAAYACIINIIPSVYRGQGLGYFLLAPSFALAIGPSFGMFLVNQYNFTVLFLTCTALSLCSFFFSWKMEGQEIARHDGTASARNTLFFEWKIVAPAITNALQFFVWGAFVAFFPLYAIQCGVENPGYFFTANAVMLIAGRILGGKILETYNKEKIILTFLLTATVAMVILSFSKTLSMFIFVGLLWGAGAAFLTPTFLAYALDYSGSSGGPAVGTYQAFQDLGMTLGPMVMGVIIPFTGYKAMFLYLALICLIDVMYFQFYVRRRNN